MPFVDALGDGTVGVGRIASALGFVLFFLLLFVPTAYSPVKGALMVAVLAAIGWRTLFEGSLRLTPTVGVWLLVCTTTSAFFMLLGLANRAPGAFRVGTVYLLWPIVYTMFAAGAADVWVLRGLARVAVFATIAIGLYAASFLLHTLGWLPSALYVPLDQGQGIGIYKGFVELNLHSISSLLFLVPFLAAALATWPRGAQAPVRRVWLWLALAAGMFVVVLSGRRALLLTVGLAPLFTVGLRPLLSAELRSATRPLLVRSAILAAAALVAAGFYLGTLGITPVTIAEMFMEGFDFTTQESGSLRRVQLWSLLAGWAEAPLFGAGHGAVAGIVRSETIPWTYELSYVALLFHVGVVGFAVYAAAVGWVAWTSARVIRRDAEGAIHATPVLVGMICFLIGNATNPYLEKFDFMWVIFWPVAVINFFLLRDDRTTR